MAKVKNIKHPNNFYFSRGTLVAIFLILLFLYIVTPQLAKFKTSISLIKHAELHWLVIGFIFALLTYTMAAASYFFLAHKPLRYLRTLVVQGASTFINLLLPAGIGSISIGFEYLRKNGHNKAQAATIVAVNNILGFIGNMILLLVIILFANTSLKPLAKSNLDTSAYLIVLIAIVIIGLLIISFKKWRRSLVKTLFDIRHDLLEYKKHLLKLVLALLSLILLTSLYTFSLWACVRALGLEINWAQALVVLTIGVAAKTATPTPGGLIGAEAGLFAGLVAYGETSSNAIAITLTYRILTYWIPLAIGGVTFVFARRSKFI